MSECCGRSGQKLASQRKSRQRGEEKTIIWGETAETSLKRYPLGDRYIISVCGRKGLHKKVCRSFYTLLLCCCVCWLFFCCLSWVVVFSVACSQNIYAIFVIVNHSIASRFSLHCHPSSVLMLDYEGVDAFLLMVVPTEQTVQVIELTCSHSHSITLYFMTTTHFHCDSSLAERSLLVAGL